LDLFVLNYILPYPILYTDLGLDTQLSQRNAVFKVWIGR